MYKEKDNSLLCTSQIPSMLSQSQADGDGGSVTATGGAEDIGMHFASSQVSVGVPASQSFLVSVSSSFDFLMRVRWDVAAVALYTRMRTLTDLSYGMMQQVEPCEQLGSLSQLSELNVDDAVNLLHVVDWGNSYEKHR